MKWENTVLVFDVTKGPKVIIESLDTYGEDGWECCSMLNVAGTNIVVFLKRRTDLEEEVIVDEQEQKISKLWATTANGNKK
jgi:hypothetical protein|tara:strand:+ start:1414 stop:1656 length:243 start_codon:yes stop_codon:yes gene_type:complete